MSLTACLVLSLLLSLLPSKITGELSPRITGGTIVSPSFKYPWQAALFIQQGNFLCGGTLISENFVLTAAHCIQTYNPYQFTIQFHRQNLENSISSENGVSTGVSLAVIHPQYNRNLSNYDVAVLKLSTPITQFTPITLDTTGEYDSQTGLSVTAIGFGASVADGPPTLQLEQVTLELWDFTECQEYYGANTIIEGVTICAGTTSGGKDTCNGDSGGPLFVENGDGSITQIGITSDGAGCGIANVPGYYSDVYGLQSFISQATDLSTTFSACSSNPCKTGYCIESLGGAYYCGTGSSIGVMKVLTIGFPFLLVAFRKILF